MNNEVVPLNWDSDFFRIKIGKLEKSLLVESEFENNLIFAKAQNYDLLYIFDEVNLDIDSEILKNFNITLVDTKVIFEKELKKEHDVLDVEILSSISEDDLQDLYFLALESGHASRYKTDKELNSKFEAFYRTWLDNSLNKILADDIFIYKINNKIVGFITLKYNDEICSIGLIAVNPNFRGNKIGEKLMQKCFFEGLQKNCNSITVATQLENSGACRFYKKLEMKIKESNKIYHSWIKK